MAADYESLKNALVAAITGTHPGTPGEVGEARLLSSVEFLKEFTNVFTTNYDLLLYWALLIDRPYPFKDGFGRNADTPAEYVVFVEPNTDDKFIYLLHGALHLTTVDGEVRKFVWKSTGIPLKDQVSDALENKQYPLVVSEG